MNRAIIAATVVGIEFGAAYAQSPDNDEGFYVGGGVGKFNIEIDGLDGVDEAVSNLDDGDTAWQAFVGWRLNPYISLQAAYIDFGRPEDDFTTSTGDHGKFGAELSGFAPSIIGTVAAGAGGAVRQAGLLHLRSGNLAGDIDDPDIDSDDSGEDVMYGVGVGVTFFERLQAKLEYEKIDLKDVDDANAFWLTGQWRF